MSTSRNRNVSEFFQSLGGKRWRITRVLPATVFVAALAMLLVVTYVLSGFRLYEMASCCMEPTIHGRGSPPSRDGDLLLVRRRFDARHLQAGDLVLVDFLYSGRHVTNAVLRVQGVPGSLGPQGASDATVAPIAEGLYYLAADSTNGIDSAVLGLIPAGQIHGKVVRVFHSDTCGRNKTVNY